MDYRTAPADQEKVECILDASLSVKFITKGQHCHNILASLLKSSSEFNLKFLVFTLVRTLFNKLSLVELPSEILVDMLDVLSSLVNGIVSWLGLSSNASHT